MSTETATATTASDQNDGRGPGGMWWVAWRQSRAVLLTLAVATAILAAGMVGFRLGLVGELRSATGDNYDVCRFSWVRNGGGTECNTAALALIDDYRFWSYPLLAAMFFGPVIVGLLAGLSLFAMELDRGSSVFTMTQSVSRLRWWSCRLLVVGVSLVVAMLALGLLQGWSVDVVADLARSPFGNVEFASRSVIPAALAVVGLAIGSTAGILLRSVLPALMVATVVAIGVLVGLERVGHDLIPTDRQTVDVAAGTPFLAFPAPPGAYIELTGFVRDDGYQTSSVDCDLGDIGIDESAFDRAWNQCLLDQGYKSRFADYLDLDRIGELRAVFTALCAAIAAVLLTAGAFVLRRRAL